MKPKTDPILLAHLRRRSRPGEEGVFALVDAVEAGEAAQEGEEHEYEDDGEAKHVVQHPPERHEQRSELQAKRLRVARLGFLCLSLTAKSGEIPFLGAHISLHCRKGDLGRLHEG